MMSNNLTSLLVVFSGLVFLLVLILRIKLPAFIALLLVSMLVGLGVGMDPQAVLKSMQHGMGGTLGFVAVVVGLGAMFGALLEVSGGVQSLASSLLNRTGTDRAPWVLGAIGFVIAIPVFFDVAFIILVPMLYSLAKKSNRSIFVFRHADVSRIDSNPCFYSADPRSYCSG
ncbi:GntP family permease [Oceanicoccus sp. KOV_DT_Chl]|uniref:GntP family permease n=1 Tax=Oceanicoccus sp. KOV_DT_Chl TaxID=1904639 RepID=UPI00190ECB10|nr:SLC13 family permease [Oceanicoccus sp. KOV_DT_Chl]